MTEEDLFLRALDVPADQRPAFLAGVCGRDDGLRNRVEILLAAHDNPGSFLAGHAAAPAAATFDAPDHSDAPSTAAYAGPTEEIGTRIGPYKLLQQLGEGGMGTVWVAEQEHPVKRRVALKVIKPGMDSARIIARFEAERQAVAMMDHTNIAKVFDAGTTPQGRPYFVMELVKGVPITTYCDELHLTIRERLDLFIQVCAAVQHAHQKGIIHRDLKPSNILVAVQDGKPVPKVIDFGVAKALHTKLADRTMYTEIGAVIGTFEYMAPEQAELSALDIDTRADVYALGVLLYELLTGSTPLTRARVKSAALAEVLRIIREEEPSKPSTRLTESKEAMASLAAKRRTEPRRLSADVRGELDWIVMRALDKDRTRRYESANGFARDIQRYLSDEPVEACPPSAGYRLRKFARKHRRTCITLAAFAVLLTGGAAVGAVLMARAIVAEREASAAQREAEGERNNAVAANTQLETANARLLRSREDLRQSLYASDFSLSIQPAWDGKRISRVLELLRNHVPKAGESDLRGFEWHYWNRLCNSVVRTVSFPVLSNSRIERAELSADGTRLFTLLQAAKKDKQIWDTGTGREVWSPLLGLQPGGLFNCAFSDDGSRIVVCRTNGKSVEDAECTAWDIRTHRQLVSIKLGTNVIWPAFSPDGSRIAGSSNIRPQEGTKYLAPVATLKVWDAQTGQCLHSHEVPSTKYGPSPKRWTGQNAAVFSPDGRRVASTFIYRPDDSETTDFGLVILDTVTTKATEVTLDMRTLGRRPAPFDMMGIKEMKFSPDGKCIAGCLPTGMICIWDADSGKQLRLFSDFDKRVERFTYNRDGSLMAGVFVDGSAQVWDVTTGKTQYTVRGPTKAIAFERDGQRLVTAGEEGAVKFWDMRENWRESVIKADQDDAPPGLRWGALSMTSMSRGGTRIAFAQSASSEPRKTQVVHRVFDRDGRELFRQQTDASGSNALSPDGRVLVWYTLTFPDPTGSNAPTESQMKVWDIAGGRELFATTDWIADGLFAFHPHGRHIAAVVHIRNGSAGRFSTSKEIRIWDIGSKEPVRVIPIQQRYPNAISFSPDGLRIIAVGIDYEPPAKGPDDGSLPTSRTNLLWAWDSETGNEWLRADLAGSFGGGQASRRLTVSADGRRFAAGVSDFKSRTYEIGIWDAQTGAMVQTIKELDKEVGPIAFSPDGKRLASCSSGGTEVNVWDVATGQRLLVLKCRPAGRVAFSPDGHRLFVGGTLREDSQSFILTEWDATPLPETPATVGRPG